MLVSLSMYDLISRQQALKELQSYNRKNRRKHNEHFELLFFMKDLHFGESK